IQALEDTELYRVDVGAGCEAALKIARPQHARATQQMFEREAAILSHLDGHANAGLVASGAIDGRNYVASEWCDGTPAAIVAERLRRNTALRRDELLRLCVAILDAYAHLHEQDVIHGDIHPRNVLVCGSTVKLIDFGLARLDCLSDAMPQPPRGGIGFFFEPEIALARLHGRGPPPATPLGRAYPLAVMLYFLLVGNHYLDFSAEKREMRRQIGEDLPLPFSPRACAWPEVEALLARALSKEPLERFASVAEFANQMRAIDGWAKQ